MKKLTALVCVGFLLAPWPPGVALNHETRECGSYMRGDEYGGRKLPAGWEAHYAGDPEIHTETGSCSFSGDAEDCCEELGYTYVGSVGDFSWSPLMIGILIYVAIVALAVLSAVGFVGLVVAACIGGGLFLVIAGGLWLRKRVREKQ